jgi:hypothetical protein
MLAESECIGIWLRGSSRGGKIVSMEKMGYHTNDDVFFNSDHGFLARLKPSEESEKKETQSDIISADTFLCDGPERSSPSPLSAGSSRFCNAHLHTYLGPGKPASVRCNSTIAIFNANLLSFHPKQRALEQLPERLLCCFLLAVI